MKNFLMIFLDGVGIGEKDYEHNPFFRYGFRSFEELFGTVPSIDNPSLHQKQMHLFPVDALLGIEGLPQSGTGQTSIFCGLNAAKFIGKHFGPYPYSTLVPIIKEQNIFIELIRRGKNPYFVNAYPSVFFEYIRTGKSRLSVTTLSCRLSGVRLNDFNDVVAENALTAEITNERWNKKLGYNLDIIAPETAARRLLKLASRYDFSLFEYFLTDHLGHGRYEESTKDTLNTLDNFLFTVLSELPDGMNLLICSDHGNVEDLSVKTHTFNPALTISAGPDSERIFSEIKDLTNIKKTILDLVDE